MLSGVGPEVDVTEIENIFKSAADEQIITQKLLKALEISSSLINVTFVLNRNLLHMAIVKNYCNLVRELRIRYPQLMTQSDRMGLTPLHYVVGKNYSEVMFGAFFPELSELINTRDTHGKTLLLHSIQDRRTEASRQLIAMGANLYITDDKGVNPYGLISKEDLAQIYLKIPSVDVEVQRRVFKKQPLPQQENPQICELIEKFNLLNIASNQQIERTAEMIATEFNDEDTLPLSSRVRFDAPSHMSSSSSLGEANTPRSSSSGSISSPRTSSLRDLILIGDVVGLKCYLEQGGDANKLFIGRTLIVNSFLSTVNTYQRLLKATESSASSSSELQPGEDHFDTNELEKDDYNILYQRQLEQLVLLLKHGRATNSSKPTRRLINYIDAKNKCHILILQQVVKKLSEQLKELLKIEMSNLQWLEHKYESRLYQSGITEFQVIPADLDTSNVPLAWLHENPNFALLIWRLCAAMKRNAPERFFDANYVSSALQVLLTQGSPNEVLTVINKLWPFFDGSQKLVSHFLLKELLIWDIHHDLCADEAFLDELEQLQDNLKRDNTFHGEALTALMTEILNIKRLAYHNIVRANCSTINNWLVLPRFTENTPSLQDLIIKGAQMQGQEQHEVLKMIAHEFRALMSYKMRTIRISEFYNKSWSHEERRSQAANILAQSHATNHLIEFIQTLILNAESTQEITSRLTFLVLLAAELCSSQEDLGPDMASVIIIMGALNSNVISRIKSSFSQLDERTLAILSQLNDLTGNRLNYKWLRTVEAGCFRSVPHLGIILQDITFAYDGNSLDYVNRFEEVVTLLGTHFKRILQIQAQIIQLPSYLLTDIRIIARAYKSVDEEELYDKSKQFASPIVNIDNLQLSELFAEIETTVMKNILARYVVNKIQYSEAQALHALFIRIKRLIDELSPSEQEIAIAESGRLFAKFGAFMNRKLPFDKTNYLFYSMQLGGKKTDKLIQVINGVRKSIYARSIPSCVFDKKEYAEQESIVGVFKNLEDIIKQLPHVCRPYAVLLAKNTLYNLAKLIESKYTPLKINDDFFAEQLNYLVSPRDVSPHEILQSAPRWVPGLQHHSENSASSSSNEPGILSVAKRKLKAPFKLLT